MKFLFAIFLCLASTLAFAQVDSTTPAYKKYPTLPPLQLLLGDSTTKYTKENLPKKKPVLIMVFSPECSHCQRTAEELVQLKDEWKDIQIVMATMHPLYQMNAFMEQYKLNTFPNVVAGKDIYYLLQGFYNLHSLPYLGFYDKKGNLITGFEGSMSVKKIIETFKQQ
jgi:thiol-disulfide isomerase/thioredoxin